MSPRSPRRKPTINATTVSARIALELGEETRAHRQRRGWTLERLAEKARLSVGEVHNIEAGRAGSIDAYSRLAAALNVEPTFLLAGRGAAGRDGAGRDAAQRGAAQRDAGRDEDPVHAAMAEVELRQLVGHGFVMAVDEPYQRYKFAGRADVVAWDLERRALLHLENRTRFPNIQEAVGSFNGKRAYLGNVLAERTGVGRGWLSETHVIVGLWSAEVVHALRVHAQSFRAVCPDPADVLAGWWSGEPPVTGRHRTLVVLDPIESSRPDRPRFVGLEEAQTARPRYRGYAEALNGLRRAGLA